MIAERVPRERVIKLSRELYRQRYGSRRSGGVVNHRPVAFLTDPMRWPFRGRIWEVPPISYRDGIEVLRLKQRLQAYRGKEIATAEACDDYEELLEEIAEFAPKLVLPDRGILRRMLWRLGLHRNPWGDATESELGEILGFFTVCRMTSTDHPARRPRSPQTSSEGSPSSA